MTIIKHVFDEKIEKKFMIPENLIWAQSRQTVQKERSIEVDIPISKMEKKERDDLSQPKIRPSHVF